MVIGLRVLDFEVKRGHFFTIPRTVSPRSPIERREALGLCSRWLEILHAQSPQTREAYSREALPTFRVLNAIADNPIGLLLDLLAALSRLSDCAYLLESVTCSEMVIAIGISLLIHCSKLARLNSHRKTLAELRD